MLKENEGQEQNCVGLTVQREARCTNDLLSDEAICGCCGQVRVYPTTEGRWRYKHVYQDTWAYVTTELDEEGLTMKLDGETEPSWWPNSVQWEKVT